eukprot:CAMPEP_0174732692 /NCGR_PEP_ID=MMETSP1094-20130205/59865_1 /TAXON_ID=156173 /ORGANISM="Chrysochromulina brevifilum, Strain UTEX LB 985" /LENGTH=625 /DNA_ID=CAMNT_0015935239 /DNA_START=23 /DNA_END=1897 /DNA_ORIENTATION=-
MPTGMRSVLTLTIALATLLMPALLSLASPVGVVQRTEGAVPALLATPWSLAAGHKRGQYTYWCGYTGKMLWNGFPHIKRALDTFGFQHGAGSDATVLVVPMYPKSAHEEWRQWRLNPTQRINRVWGMMKINRKGPLHRTLDAHWGGSGKCPFIPATYDWNELIRRSSRSSLRALLLSKSSWLLKTAAHKGKGVNIVSSADLLRLALDEGDGAATAVRHLIPPSHRLHHSGLMDAPLLQSIIDNPLLVGGHKSSLRLYALITSALPMRVYLFDEGFALFASNPVDMANKADPRSFLTNAYQSRGGVHSLSSSGSTEAELVLAQSMGLGLPPRTLRWSLSQFLRFIAARDGLNGDSGEGGLSGGGDGSGHAAGAGGGVDGGGGVSGLSRGGGETKLRRQLERLVLSTWVAARAPLAAAARESLHAMGLAGLHEYAGTFELTAFDVMLDESLRPWLLELNTSPSLKVEDSSSSTGNGGDLLIKERLIKSILSLADALPEERIGPEAMLLELMADNGQTLGAGASGFSAPWSRKAGDVRARDRGPEGGCAQRWRHSGCRHCPSWEEVGALWRALTERRRAGGFQVLDLNLLPHLNRHLNLDLAPTPTVTTPSPTPKPITHAHTYTLTRT